MKFNRRAQFAVVVGLAFVLRAQMCLLFVVGVMNLLGIAAIAIWVLAEKTLA